MSNKIEKTGVYNARVTAAWLDSSRGKGTPFVGLTFETEDGLTINHKLHLTEKTIVRNVGLMTEVLGFSGDFKDLDSMLGGECSITVDEEVYNDKKRLIVQWVNTKLEEAPSADALADELNALASKMTGKQEDKEPF